MVFDEEAYQYQTPPKSPIPAAVLTSIITSAAVFFGLRELDQRGLLGKARPAQGGIEVPAVLGLKPDQARELLQGRGLMLSLSGEQEDSKYPAGSIASQTPLAGSQAVSGSAVQAVVSRGTGQVQVPNVVGLKADDAHRQLTAAGLQVGPQKTAASATVPAGSVAQTEPAAGAPLPPQGAVILVVSSGAPSKAVPKVTGVRLPRARKILEDAGFVLGKIHYGVDEDRMGGLVLRQDPAEGTASAPGAPVNVTVNED